MTFASLQECLMPRIKELGRVATLERHVRKGLVSHIEIIDDNERLRVCVHYNERAEGEKTRFLTAHKTAGPRRFANLVTVWRFLNEHGIDSVILRKARAGERSEVDGGGEDD